MSDIMKEKVEPEGNKAEPTQNAQNTDQKEPKKDDNVVLRTEKLYRIFKRGKFSVNALDGVSFQIYNGEFVSITGKSGSGKSTLLNILGTLDTPTKGEVYIGGEPISKMDDSERTALRRKRIGFVFQDYNLIPVLNAVENVELPLFNAGISKEKRRQKALDMLEIVGLRDRADHKPDELSGGQSQRVSVARALVSDPTIVLADEPTGALDTKTGTKIMNLFDDLNKEQGHTIIMVTHDVALADRATRKIVLKDGKVIKDQTV